MYFAKYVAVQTGDMGSNPTQSKFFSSNKFLNMHYIRSESELQVINVCNVFTQIVPHPTVNYYLSTNNFVFFITLIVAVLNSATYANLIGKNLQVIAFKVNYHDCIHL